MSVAEAHMLTIMDERLRKFFIPSCVILILSTAFVYELKCVIDILFFKKKHILIIGILSAPENFQQRLSIRKTWLQLLSEISGSAYFIVGNEICDTPPYDRVDPYSCVAKPFVLPRNVTPQTEFTTMKVGSENFKSDGSVPSFIGFSFYVRRTIIVKKLGILKQLLLLLKREIQVKLFSSFDNRLLASVTFNSEFLNETSSLFITKVIKPVRLDAAFEGFVKLETRDLANVYFPSCHFTEWQSEPHVINFIQLWQENSVIPHPFVEKSCTFPFMVYSILDTESLIQQTNNRTLRMKEWRMFKKKLAVQLTSENKIYNDMLFVNVVDVYRNLSMKMTQFYKRMLETEYFQYILKADDDSFIDLVRVYNQLVTVNRELNCKRTPPQRQDNCTEIEAKQNFSKFWLWSFFKEFWKVERAGKWREDQYKSASYPTFPCGGGYVMNKAIVEYLTKNEPNLHHFQGEDVSLGIWLSPLPVTQYKTPKLISERNSNHLQKKIIKRFTKKRFLGHSKVNNDVCTEPATNLCEWTCSKKRKLKMPLCNKIQLSINNMYTTWKDYINKGFL